MGILPQPHIRRPEDKTISKAKQIGYFPLSVLDTIEKLMQYKQEGRRMAEICKLLGELPIGPEGIRRYGQADPKRIASDRGRVSDYGTESEELFPLLETQTENIATERASKGVIRALLKSGKPNLFHFSVLVAEIQDSAKICAELPSDEYIDLIRQVLRSTTLSLKKYFGVYGKHPDNGIVFYFLKECDASYLMNALVCALELRELMKEMSRKWKRNKGSSGDLYLNIGIAEGHESIGSIPAVSAVDYVSLGDSLHSARLLSDLARSGSIWTTKNFLNRLAEKDSRQIRYGILRREENRDVLAEGIFSRVMDLVTEDDPKHSKYIDIWTLPVTEIQGLR